MRRVVGCCLPTVLLALTACGSGSGGQQATGPTQPCTSLPAADPDATLPAGFPRLEGQVLYGPVTEGATTVVLGRVQGDDFAGLRDRLADDLEAAGYRVDAADQGAVEAEARFSATASRPGTGSATASRPGTGSSPREGSVRVTRLCEGVLQVRYRLSG